MEHTQQAHKEELLEEDSEDVRGRESKNQNCKEGWKGSIDHTDSDISQARGHTSVPASGLKLIESKRKWKWMKKIISLSVLGSF